MNARRTLGALRAPDEVAAEHRAWAVVSSAYASTARPAPVRSRRGLLAVPVVAGLIGAIALSPAGAAVRRWINQALGAPHPAPALFSLPAPGTLLVSGGGGTWTVAANGAARRLGAWGQGTWSPHALFAAVARRDELAAVDPHGTPRWTLARPAISDPSWYAPSGYRVAYLSDHELRVVAGDGTGDHLLATSVASVAPAWEPGHPYRVAYVTGGGRVVVRDGDSGGVIWTVAPNPRPAHLSWSADGSELLAVGRDRAWIFDARGRAVFRSSTPGPIVDAALSPNGRSLALVAGGASQDVELIRLGLSARQPRRVFSGDGLAAGSWSPDGRWLLVSWPAANQWVFVRVGGGPRILAVSRIRAQFGISRWGAFPRIDGWCCTAAGTG
jgi:hypothetical protein